MKPEAINNHGDALQSSILDVAHGGLERLPQWFGPHGIEGVQCKVRVIVAHLSSYPRRRGKWPLGPAKVSYAQLKMLHRTPLAAFEKLQHSESSCKQFPHWAVYGGRKTFDSQERTFAAIQQTASMGSFRAFAASFSNDSFGPKVIMVKGMAFRLPQRHINL